MNRQRAKLDEINHPMHENPGGSSKSPNGATAMIIDMKSLAISEQVPPRIFGVRKGTVAGFAEHGEPLVDYDGNVSTASVPAETTVILTSADIGRMVVLQFENGDPQKPIVTGIIRKPEEMARAAEAERLLAALSECAEASIHGDRLVLTLTRNSDIQCGESLVSMTQDGKIVIEGKQIISRSWGLNRVEGASVKIN